MWKCEFCQTKNKFEETTCKNCFRRPKEKTRFQEEQTMGLTAFYKQARRFLFESDFSKLKFLSYTIGISNGLILLAGIIFGFNSIFINDLITGMIIISSTIVITTPGLIMPFFINLMLELKTHSNQTTQELYVSNRIQVEQLNLFKELKKHLNPQTDTES